MKYSIPLIGLALAGCQTSNGDQWNGSGIKPYRQAENSCFEQTKFVADEADQRDFFIACMGALGWTPKPGATIDL